MKKILLTFYFVLGLSALQAQSIYDLNSSPQQLQDLVQLRGDHYYINEHFLASSFDQSLHIELIARGPKTEISRDDFISIYSIMGNVFRSQYLNDPDDQNTGIKIETLQNFAGKADLTIRIYLSNKGMQIRIAT